MSKWTHVCGLIYLDHFNLKNDLKQRDNFGDILVKLFKNGIPTGSEGPLSIKAVKGNAAGSANMGDGGGFITVSYRWCLIIFGDLRDFSGEEDIGSIIDWLNKKTAKLKSMCGLMRQGIILINSEVDKEKIWQPKID